MDIVLQSSDLYSKYLMVTALSILDSNRNVERITLHILSDNISDNMQSEIINLTNNYNNADVIIYDMKKYCEILTNYAKKFHGSYSTYLKLFIAEILPVDISRVLYLDVDILVVDSLEPLFEIDMKDNVVAGVESIIDISEERGSKGIIHINGGVQLYDLNKCREINITNVFINKIKELGDKIPFADQTILHECLEGSIYSLELRYNLVTPAIVLDYSRFLAVYDLSEYYSIDVYNAAKNRPAVFHCTAWNCGRPWEKYNVHPCNKLYRNYLDALGFERTQNSIKKFIRNLCILTIRRRFPEKFIRYFANRKGVVD